jgi:hypothetical protein
MHLIKARLKSGELFSCCFLWVSREDTLSSIYEYGASCEIFQKTFRKRKINAGKALAGAKSVVFCLKPQVLCPRLDVRDAGIEVLNTGLKVGDAGIEVGNKGLKVWDAGIEFRDAGLRVGNTGIEVGNRGLQVGNANAGFGKPGKVGGSGRG